MDPVKSAELFIEEHKLSSKRILSTNKNERLLALVRLLLIDLIDEVERLRNDR